MRRSIYKILLAAVALISAVSVYATGKIITDNLSLNRAGGKLYLSADFILDSLKLKSQQQIFVTPVITGENEQSISLPTILLTGRGMHYAYERGTMRNLKKFKKRYDILKEVRRLNGHIQSVDYAASVPFEPWMLAEKVSLKLMYDTCGCGVYAGTGLGPQIDTTLNPVRSMRVAYITPKVTDLPISIHEGRARVQFEVDRTDLHDQVYRTRNGQIIDNRDQLKVIFDSIEYALNDPNVEIAGIEIVGYASPESPYEHNRDLATGRSRALAEYIGRYVGDKYSIDPSISRFDAVPENWQEFREQVVNSDEISEKQRADLLELIDRPAYGPSDYDAKERELKTNPKFKDLYYKKILPEWFPHLRATKFRISTRLKPLSDEKLAEVILTSPEKMSLNQMYRVARLYDEDSPEFKNIIETALRYYPDDIEANTLGAVLAIKSGDYGKAENLLKRAGNSPEAFNARGIIATHKGDFQNAAFFFDNAGDLPEAKRNKALLEP